MRSSIAISFALSLLLHFAILSYFFYLNVQESKRVVYIEDIELIEEISQAIEEEPEESKGIFSLSEALQTLKERIKSVITPLEEEPVQVAEKPLDVPSGGLSERLGEEEFLMEEEEIKLKEVTPSLKGFEGLQVGGEGEEEVLAEIKIGKGKSPLPVLEGGEEGTPIKIADIGWKRAKYLPRKKVVDDVVGSTQTKISIPKHHKKPMREVAPLVTSTKGGGESLIKIGRKKGFSGYRIARRGKVVSGAPKIGEEVVGRKIKIKGVKRVVVKRRSPSGEGGGFKMPLKLTRREEGRKIAEVSKKRILPQKLKVEQKTEELIKKEPKVAKVERKNLKEERKIILSQDVEKILKEEVKREEIREVKKPPPKLVEIKGVLSKRKVERSFLPAYPEWAEREGIEAEVAIRFAVSPEGFVVKTHISQTSGYGALDRLAVRALKQWVFSPLPKDAPRITQWGLIIFRFLLR